jgi:hypothetical protein
MIMLFSAEAVPKAQLYQILPKNQPFAKHAGIPG